MRDCIAFDAAPSDISFDCHHYAKRNLQVCIAANLRPQEVIVRAGKWPFSGVRVYVDGKRWGWRGEASGVGQVG